MSNDVKNSVLRRLPAVWRGPKHCYMHIVNAQGPRCMKMSSEQHIEVKTATTCTQSVATSLYALEAQLLLTSFILWLTNDSRTRLKRWISTRGKKWGVGPTLRVGH